MTAPHMMMSPISQSSFKQVKSRTVVPQVFEISSEKNSAAKDSSVINEDEVNPSALKDAIYEQEVHPKFSQTFSLKLSQDDKPALNQKEESKEKPQPYSS